MHDVRALRQRARVLSALASPAMMGRYVQGRAFQMRSHLQLIDDHLVRMAEIRRLMVLMPPRAGKSELVCRLLPLWTLARDPTKRVVISSYTAQLAQKSGRAVRSWVGETGKDFGLALQPGAQQVNDWYLTAGGGLRSVGVGGSLTGNDMDLGICDDPVKDRAQADSLTYQRTTWDWWTSTFVTRRYAHTPVILVMTRWAPGDLGGRLLDAEGRVEEGGRWTVLHLEAVCTGKFPDPLGRAPGDPLPHPRVVDDREQLLAHWEEQRIAAAQDWFALFQGDPQPREGALVTRELMAARIHLTDVPEPVKSAVAVDPAADGRDIAGVLAGYLGTDRRLYVTHDRSARMNSDGWSRAACELAVETDAERVIIELSGVFGLSDAKMAVRTAWTLLRQEWAEEHDGDNPYDRLPPNVVGVRAKKGKVLRAEPIAGQIRSDRMRLAGSFPDLVREWTTWQPTSSHSPGRIDASVYLAYDLLPVPGAGQTISTAADVSRDRYRGSGGAPRRPY